MDVQGEVDQVNKVAPVTRLQILWSLCDSDFFTLLQMYKNLVLPMKIKMAGLQDQLNLYSFIIIISIYTLSFS